MGTANLKSFHYLENGDITFSIMDTIKTEKKLDVGVYNLGYNYPQQQCTLSKLEEKKIYSIHNFTDKEKIDAFLNSFFSKKTIKKVEDLGFMHKIGFLFYGKEGTGKTTIAKHYYSIAIEKHNALVFYMNQYDNTFVHCWDLICEIRKIQNNPIFIILEEFDGYLNYNLNQMKSILDGNLSISNVLFFASTNEIDKIPPALRNRESRFKFTINIEGIDNKSDILAIINKMLIDLYTESDIDSFANDLIGKTLDEIKQFCLDKIMNIDVYSKPKSKIGFY